MWLHLCVHKVHEELLPHMLRDRHVYLSPKTYLQKMGWSDLDLVDMLGNFTSAPGHTSGWNDFLCVDLQVRNDPENAMGASTKGRRQDRNVAPVVSVSIYSMAGSEVQSHISDVLHSTLFYSAR